MDELRRRDEEEAAKADRTKPFPEMEKELMEEKPDNDENPEQK